MTSRIKYLGDPSGVSADGYETKNGAPHTGPSPYTQGVDFYSHAGENTPDYHARKKAGELLPMTSWEQNEVTGVNTCTRTYTKAPSGDVYVNTKPKSPSNWLISQQELDQIVIDLDLETRSQAWVTNAAAYIYSQGFDALTFVAELHKTVHMFKNFGKSLKDLAQKRDIYNQWLQGRYGWRILMFELKELAQVLSQLDVSRERFKQRNGEGGSETTLWSANASAGYGDYTYNFRDELYYSLRGNVIADIKPPDFTFNPILTKWELIPYSFVIDWFVNVGAWLESMSFLTLTQKYVAARGYRVELKRTLLSVDFDPNASWSEVSHIYETRCHAVRTVRTPTTVSYTPSILLRLDDLKVVDLIALVLQQLSRRK
jgi:hypothetical protein